MNIKQVALMTILSCGAIHSIGIASKPIPILCISSMHRMISTVHGIGISPIKRMISPVHGTVISMTILSCRTIHSASDDKTMSIALLDMGKPADVALLNSYLDEMIAKREADISDLKPTHDRMRTWYSTEFPEGYKRYTDDRTLELVAEATFWAYHMPVRTFIEALTYAEIRKFQPLRLSWEETDFGRALDDCFKKIKKPSMSHEASFAMQQAAWSLHIKKVGKDVFDAEQEAYSKSSL
jgi:hypothetical protein